MICNNCRNRIDSWHKFKEQCKHCDDVLRHCNARNVGLKLNTGKQTHNDQLAGTGVSSQEVVTEQLVKGERDLEADRSVDLGAKNGCLLQVEKSPVKTEPAFHTSNAHSSAKEDSSGTSDDTACLSSRSDVLDNPCNDFDTGSVKLKLDDIERKDDKPSSREIHKTATFRNVKSFNKNHNLEESSDCKTYGCSQCGKTFSYTSHFTFHVCNLTPEKRFVCNLCGKDYSTAGAVKTHLHIHKGKHKCPTCGKSFPSKFQVEVHMRIHTGEKPYVCEYCGKRFAYDKGLALHMSVHTGVKPYKCDECSYSTTSRSYIKNHKSVHRTEKPFVCEICGQGYTLLPSLMNHQLNHNDQKTYTCEVCNKAFNTSRKLGSHKIMHSGVRPYHCEDCGKRFARKEGLKEHKVIHTGEKKFLCPICKKQFAWRKVLRTHKCAGTSDHSK
jgi:hypothetical protein